LGRREESDRANPPALDAQGRPSDHLSHGNERSAVGYASVASNPYADPKAKNEKIVVVDLKAGKRLANPVTLDQIKSDKTFAGFDLIRIGRLSIVPVPDAMWKRIEELSSN
jgi:predicted RNA-binding protein with PUA-like domain